MNLQTPNGTDATQTRNRSRDIVPGSGLCSRCVDGCRGNCEVFQASFRGREILYPGPYGHVTAGADKDYPIDYSHLNIQGYAFGAEGLPEGVAADSDHAIFPAVNTETQFGTEHKVRLRLPVFTGALGSTEIARKNWEHFAIGAAISGISLVCGENVCGIDPGLELGTDGMVFESPELRRRVELYRAWRDNGYGDIHVQLNVEDTRFGVAEYAVEKLGVTTVELKWGQGAKCIGGEIKVDSLERALELQRRGYIVTPDPSLETNQIAFKATEIKEFERHSRLGFIDQEAFMNQVAHLRKIGAERITLKTGAYPARELAMALKWSSDAKIDLVTVDGAPGGTGMSPWRMMEEWGVPTFYLQSMCVRFADLLAAKGAFVPDLAMGGGFSTEDHIFKVLAMGAPHFKAVCMGRALMIPGMAGKNLAKWIEDRELPSTISQYGNTPEEIFVTYEELKMKYGPQIDRIPLGAVGLYTFSQKLRVGLQQLMAGSRSFNIPSIQRTDLMALSEEAARVSGIPYVMDAYQEEAERILN
jgi:glutamate synthase domain-containing protein 2